MIIPYLGMTYWQESYRLRMCENSIITRWRTDCDGFTERGGEETEFEDKPVFISFIMNPRPKIRTAAEICADCSSPGKVTSFLGQFCVVLLCWRISFSSLPLSFALCFHHRKEWWCEDSDVLFLFSFRIFICCSSFSCEIISLRFVCVFWCCF